MTLSIYHWGEVVEPRVIVRAERDTDRRGKRQMKEKEVNLKKRKKKMLSWK